MSNVKKENIETQTPEVSEKKKTLLQKIDSFGENLGTGILSIEGQNSQQIWEQAYVKPTYEDYEHEGKTTHIVVEQKNIKQKLGQFPFIISSKKDK